MRSTMLSLIHHDPTLVAKASPEVAARRARFTRVVKGVVGVIAALGVLALGKVTVGSASAAEETPVASESSSDEHRVVRALDVTAVKAQLPARGAVKASPHVGAKALLVRGGGHR